MESRGEGESFLGDIGPPAAVMEIPAELNRHGIRRGHLRSAIRKLMEAQSGSGWLDDPAGVGDRQPSRVDRQNVPYDCGLVA
jgi:hypothetical protein